MKLEKILLKYNKEELKVSLTYLGLFFNENDTEDDLRNMILSYLLNFDNFKKILKVLPEYSYNKIISGETKFKIDEDMRLYNELKVYSLGFGDSRKVELADEFIEYLNKIDFKEFSKSREKQLWLYACVNFGNTFYGIYNFDVLEKMIIQNTKIHMSRTEIRTRFLDLPQSVECEYFDSANMIVNKSYSDEIKEILKRQGNKPFYIPSYKEIMEFFMKGYINNVYYDLYENYKAYLNDGLGDETKIIMYNQLATNYTNLDEIFREFYSNIKFETIQKLNECKSNFESMALTTRNVYNRGFTSQEITNIRN
jgi:hypothetical protein